MQSRALSRLRSYYRRSSVIPISDNERSVQLRNLVRSIYSSSSRPRREGYSSKPRVPRPEWLIGKLCKVGKLAEARKLFDGLPERDVVTWTDVITGYIKLGNMREARELFDRVDSRKNVVTWTAMVSGYLRSKQLSVAETLFQEMPERNIVSWNTMIDGYAQSGRIDKALELFDEMPERNTVSWNTMIKALVQRGRIDEAMNLFERMPIKDVISWTAMVDGLAKNGKVDEARRLFDCMPERNIISWNAMITGYTYNNRIDEADQLFQVMPERDFASWNTMITGFIRNREINRACGLFDRMPQKNVISWTAMITGYVENKENEEALKVFSKMLRDGCVKPNVGTYVSILSACSDLAGLVEGQQIHQLISKSVHQENEVVTSALINMYSKSGELIAARKMFDNGLVCQRDLISWNSMIAVYAHHGHGKEAIEIHAGLVEKGMEFFKELVRDESLPLREEHYTCLVDLCGRAGRLKDVLNFINCDDARLSRSFYGAILSACNVHSEVSIAKEVVKKVLETGSDDAGTYVMMSNIYAASGKREKAAEMRMKMKEKGLKKQPGCSWVKIGNQTHLFVVGDKSHPQFEALDSIVSDLRNKMRKNKNMTSEAEEDEFLVL
ncbi:pentatricopeptide repeat-containing protein At2g35030, mitochondrial isoform X2 [Arabidopsis lyrata subsp. lyrata]|uniref:pentatricopeptide repeat-containing protein At2g35030, mitochondrial isoform X2 n=1 Tax=Arabidopsis lyrata subsp. lyrata TaxID=81972 RepID=UPI000A29D7C5|nr:pentatricopeptide repeat-containing protein At2g35030, mitochondrial isoform X2 [Arabidopsis lyrata subsp. lyrata]|eukprot:XP_020883012.1 pentatricopeptide repeat-containing protein At2g35030, mitochondrial isoform X2 [Arabidopsis lyrata subsp. lyrata]